MTYNAEQKAACFGIFNFIGGMVMEKERKQAQTRILRKPELLAMVGLSDPTIWRMEKDGKFPKRIRLGGNSCGWISDEVDSWLEERMAERVAA